MTPVFVVVTQSLAVLRHRGWSLPWESYIELSSLRILVSQEFSLGREMVRTHASSIPSVTHCWFSQLFLRVSVSACERADFSFHSKCLL
jgi:hypothetical protein